MSDRETQPGVGELLKQFEKGAPSALDVAADAVSRIAAADEINAVQTFDRDIFLADAKAADTARARGDAGPLCGVPFAVKDNINTMSYPTSGGTKALLGHVPPSDAGAIGDLKAAGGIVAAKTGMHELAFGITSNNAVTGAVRNPHDSDRIAGGSSGGTAAAVAAGLLPVGLGTDTGGSCRIPAALCGVVGFRPTTGRYKSDGVIPISHTRDTIGTIARGVTDVVLVDQVLSGSAESVDKPDLTSVRLGVPQAVFYDDLEPEVDKAVQSVLLALDRAGVTLVDVDWPEIWPHNEAFSFPVVFYEVMRDLPAYLSEHAPTISFEQLLADIGSPDVAGAFASQSGDGAMPEDLYSAAMDIHRPAMQKIYADSLTSRNLNAIIFPTTPLTARPVGEDETVDLNGARVPTFPTYIRNTDLGSNLGVPGLSLPCPDVDRLPVGFELDGHQHRDADLLGLALAVEEALSH